MTAPAGAALPTKQARASSGCTARYLGASSSDCHKGGAMGLFARPPLTRATAASTEHGRPGWRPAPPPLLAWQFLPLCRKQGARCTPGERLGCCRSSAAAADLQCVASTPAPGAPTVCAAPPQAPANGIRAEPGANSVKATLLPATPASGGSCEWAGRQPGWRRRSAVARALPALATRLAHPATRLCPAAVGVRYRLKLTQQALPGGGRRLHAALPSYQLTSDSNVFNVTPGMAADNGAVVGQLCGATWLVEGAWGNAGAARGCGGRARLGPDIGTVCRRAALR